MDFSLLAWGDTGWGDEVLRGAGWTVVIAALAFLMGTLIGMVAASAKLRGGRVLGAAMDIYTTVFRGVPELLVIFLLFYGSSSAIMSVARVFGHTGYLELPPFGVGVLAVGIISGAYSTEVFRGAVLVIPQGQIEAGRAYGMSPLQIFRRITLPQMMHYALPGLGNVWQLTLKDTALVSVTSFTELVWLTHRASGSTREPFLFWIVAALLYLAMTSVSERLFQAGERFYNRGMRRA